MIKRTDSDNNDGLSNGEYHFGISTALIFRYFKLKDQIFCAKDIIETNFKDGTSGACGYIKRKTNPSDLSKEIVKQVFRSGLTDIALYCYVFENESYYAVICDSLFLPDEKFEAYIVVDDVYLPKSDDPYPVVDWKYIAKELNVGD